MKRKTMIELFSGSGSMASSFREIGYDVFTIDINPDCNPDMVADINEIGRIHMPLKFLEPDVIWAGLDCTYWSRANNKGNHLGKGGTLLTQSAREAKKTAINTLNFIKELNPKFWFIENPGGNGGLKQQNFMKKYPMVEIYYCQYGGIFQKPTCIWGKFPSKWIPKTVCSCIKHEGNIEDKLSGQLNRSEYPLNLMWDISNACNLSESSSWITLEEFV